MFAMSVDIINLGCISLGAILLLLSFIGCFVPVLPGPWLALAGVVCARGVAPHDRPSLALLIASAALVVAVQVLDYLVPALGAKKFHCGKAGIFGCLAGTLVGIFFFPLGLILGPFLGAFLGELLSGKEIRRSLVGATGAFLGFVAGLFLKLFCCGVLATIFVFAVT